MLVGKGENAGNQHFLLFPQYFLPFYIFQLLHKQWWYEKQLKTIEFYFDFMFNFLKKA